MSIVIEAPSLEARRVLRMAFLIAITLEDIVSLSLSNDTARLHPLSSVIGTATSGLDASGDQGDPDRSFDRSIRFVSFGSTTIDLPSTCENTHTSFEEDIRRYH